MGATCPVETSSSSPSLFQNGNLVFQAHHVGWIVAGFFTIVACVASFWLVNKHLQWYTNKREQRYIVRLLFMVPIYAVISLSSYFFWNHATPLLLIRDAYESTVLTAFFYLLLTYLSPDPEDQKAIFLKAGLSRAADAEALAKGEEPRKWMFPLGFIKSKPTDGLYFLQMMKWGVLQYCVIRPSTTLVAVILNYIGWYCEGSWNPEFGYVYITVIVSISVSVAMYCLIQVYMPIAVYLAPQKPLLKLFSVKAVVFLTFWQATFLSVLSMFGVVKDTQYMTADDINIGIAALLETFEMMLFAFLHVKAFSYKPYRPFHDPRSKAPPPERTPRLRALGHAFDFRETFREIRAGYIYIVDKMRGREPTPDKGARRFAHYESAFGRARPSNLPTSKALATNEAVDAEKGLLLSSSQQSERRNFPGDLPWLKLPNDSRRERSESLEAQIERELNLRGYGSNIPGRGHIGLPPETVDVPGHKPHRSWWRSVYSRVSQSVPDAEDEQRLTSPPSRKRRLKSQSRHRSRDITANQARVVEQDFEDPPPPSLFRPRRGSAQGRKEAYTPQMEELDGLAPLSVFSTPHSQPRSMSPPMLFSPSSDSLFGRVFPTSTNPSSSADHPPASDNERSLPSVSTHGVSSSKATPRGRLVPAPQVLGQGGPSHAMQRPVAHLTPPPQRGTGARSVEAVTGDSAEWTHHSSHSRESALHRPPVLALNTTLEGLATSPSSAEFNVQEFGGERPRKSKRSAQSGLRRQSAQVYSPDSPSRRGRRQSLEVTAPQIPQSSYARPASGHTHREERGRQTRRTSTAPLPAPPHRQSRAALYEEELRRSGYSVENMRSDITQPSLSAFPTATTKYPAYLPSTLVMPTRLASAAGTAQSEAGSSSAHGGGRNGRPVNHDTTRL